METHRAAIDDAAGVERGRAVNLAAKPELGVFVRLDDAGFGLPQGGENLLGIVPDRGDNPHSGDDDASHAAKLLLDIAARSPNPGAFVQGQKKAGRRFRPRMELRP